MMEAILMIDVAGLTTFLAPALPILIKMGNQVTDGALSKIGEDGWDRLKKLWPKLWPKAQADAVTMAAMEKVANNPTDLDRQVVLKMALQDLLAQHPALAQELADLWKNTEPPATIRVTIKSEGDGNTNVGVNYGNIHSPKP